MSSTHATSTREARTRAREEATLALSRLFASASTQQLHSQSVQLGLEAALRALSGLFDHEDGVLSLLFVGEDVFVSGQPLEASRSTYDVARRLGAHLAAMGANALRVSRGVRAEGFMVLLRHFKARRDGAPTRTTKKSISPHITLRHVDPASLSEDTGDEADLEGQATRAVARAIVLLRRLHRAVGGGRRGDARALKHLAQSLVTCTERDPSTMSALTAMRGGREDHANTCVCAAITATLAASLLTRDPRALARVCHCALTSGLGEHRLARLRRRDDPFASAEALTPTSAERARAPSSDAVALVALSGLHPSNTRRVPLSFEASWILHDAHLGPVYGGKIAPNVEALIVAFAHALQRALCHDRATDTTPTPDDAIEAVTARAATAAERFVLGLVLCGMGLHARGTAVALSSGWRGVVLGTPYDPSSYGRPTVRLLLDPDGRPCAPLDLDLSIIHPDVARLGGIARVLRGDLHPALRACQEDARAGRTPTPRYPEPGVVQTPNRAEVEEMISRVSLIAGAPAPSPDASFDDMSYADAVSLTGSQRERSAAFARRADADAAARPRDTPTIDYDGLLHPDEPSDEATLMADLGHDDLTALDHGGAETKRALGRDE